MKGTHFKTSIIHLAGYSITILLLLTLMISIGGCATVQTKEAADSISNLSFSHDGKKILFDRCRNEGCQIQVYDLETGELAAYQSPANERWTMAKCSYDGKKIVFAVMPIRDEHLELADMQIAVMDSDGKNFKKITTGPGAKLYPIFSHSGKKVLYSRTAYMRKSGKTPAAQYDAWEVDLATGTQTQLTYFKYFYMGYLTYFPDDERFIFYGEMPEAFPGIKDGDQAALKNKFIELSKKGIGLHATVVMKGKEMIPKMYHFGENIYPQRPLLSKDSSRLIFEKGASAGKFYLYSPDGNHRLVCTAGSVHSVAISPEGEYIGICFGESIFVTRVADGTDYRAMFLRRSKNWDENVRKMPHLRLLPELPSIIINK